MEKRKNPSFKPLEPELDGQPQSRENADENVQPSLCIALRQARLKAGVELPDVAKALRIQHAHLESLEEGRFADLPGNTYAVGFLRSYSEFLGLDPEDMIRRYKQESVSGGFQSPLSFPVPSKEGRAPKPWLILAVLVLAGAAYGGWYYYSMRGTDDTDLVSDLSSKLTEAAGVDTAEEVAAADARVDAASELNTEASVGGVDEESSLDIADTTDKATDDSTTATDSFVSADNATLVPPVAEAPEADVGSDGGQSPVSNTSLWDEAVAVDESASEGVVVDPEPAPAPAPAIVTEVIDAVDDVELDVAAVEAPDTPPALASDPVAADTSNSSAETIGTIETTASDQSTSLWDTASSDAGRDVVEDAATTPSGATETLNEGAVGASLEGADGRGALGLQGASSATSGQTYVPQVYGRGNEDYRVVITAKADSWVQVQGPQNELLLTRILRAGDSYRVPDREGLVMVTGNAGALQISVDGVVVQSVGPIGVVRRDVVLDAEQLKAGITTE
ncbi:MAG: DUF4115 domain-containing protein [Alphaproteobacteria bacterium]|nr:DUF4115 domain-containing protein [Alphaproteobacteria bacterium]